MCRKYLKIQLSLPGIASRVKNSNTSSAPNIRRFVAIYLKVISFLDNKSDGVPSLIVANKTSAVQMGIHDATNLLI